MQTMMGIITNTKSEELLQEITRHRSMPAVPFGSRYRLIDFVLSNMVNSGIRNVAVITSHNYRALLDHLGSGKEWGLDRKSEGLIILPSASPSIFRKTLRFDLKDLYANFDSLEKSWQQYVVMSGNNMVCNIDYRKVLEFHRQKGAHLTVVYKEEDEPVYDTSGFLFYEIKEDNRVSALLKHPNRTGNSNVSLEMLLLEKKFLQELIRLALASGNWDLADLMANNLGEMKVYAYPFYGYLAKINSIDSYFKCSMSLLDPQVYQELFFSSGPIYTKTKDGPPTKYTAASRVKNTLVATGCRIDGTVENSILFRGVSVGNMALVKNSIIMQKSTIEDGVTLENVILDKEVVIRKGAVLKGKEGHPLIIGKKSVI